jgi:hypothetical protein
MTINMTGDSTLNRSINPIPHNSISVAWLHLVTQVQQLLQVCQFPLQAQIINPACLRIKTLRLPKRIGEH